MNTRKHEVPEVRTNGWEGLAPTKSYAGHMSTGLEGRVEVGTVTIFLTAASAHYSEKSAGSPSS